jgi:hypothetical protein
MSNTSLCTHIEACHLEEFTWLAAERGWKIWLKGLLSQARSQATSEAAAAQAGQPQFDEETFRQYLLNFIVANDQVCLC